MHRLAGGGIAGLLLAATLVGARADVARAPATAGLPDETARGVVVALADGDRFEVSVSRDLREVRGRRYDAATGTWGARTVVLRRANLYCGDVDARAAGTSVAVIAQCDRSGYAEDQAPTDSRALWSDDLLTWRTHRLEGEAHEEPGISPDGRSAVWPLHQGYLTLTPAEGFVARPVSLPGQEYTVTAAIGDDGRVSVLYGASDPSGSGCGLAVATRLGDGPTVRQWLDASGACGDVTLANTDAHTVLLGDPGSAAYVTTITRPDTASPWALTAVAPAQAPGLVERGGRARTTFLDSPGLPLVALSSADRRTVEVQVYDAPAQQWGPLAPVTTLPGPCRWTGPASAEPFGVLVARLSCGGRTTALVSSDGSSWSTVPVTRHPLGVSTDRRWVSASTRRATTVFSRELGRVVLPVGATRRCDAVLPSGPDAVLRLTTTRTSGWPTVLQASTAAGWRRTDTAVPRARAGTDTCRRLRVDLYEPTPSYTFSGRLRVTTLSVTARGDGWRVRRGPR